MPADATTNDTRWRGRPVASVAVRLLSYALPVGASVLAAIVIGRLLPDATSLLGRLGSVAVVLVGSTIVLLVVDLGARRLLPLSVLLRMTMAFPDTAPSRYKVARRAGRVRDIEEQVHQARERGLDDEPVVAATQLLVLIAALSRHDRATRGHAERTRVFVEMLAEELDLSTEDRDRLRWAALLHDIGKLHVPPRILNKPDRPTDHEWDLLRQHPAAGMAIAAPLHDFLGPWASTIEHHHERWDGGGYPHGVAGDAISYGGRIVAVADSFEVMTAARPYKQPMSASEARAELTRCAGGQFDPRVVRAFLGISLGRLRWTIGPLAWLAQSPVLLNVGSRAVDATVAVSRAAAAVAVGGAAAVSGGIVAMPASFSLPFTSSDEPAPAQPSDTTTIIADDSLHGSHRARIAAARAAGWSGDGPTDSPQPDGGAATGDPTDAPASPPATTHDTVADGAASSQPATHATSRASESASGVAAGVSGTVTAVTDAADEVVDAVTEVTDSVTDPVTDVVTDVTDSVTEVTDSVTQSVTDVTDSVSDPVTDVTDSVTGSVDDLADSVIDLTDSSADSDDSAD